MKIKERLCDLLWPARCAGCGELLPFGDEGIFCPACSEAWEEAGKELCSECGKPQRECTCTVGQIHQVHLIAYHPGRNGPCERMLLKLKNKKLKKVFAFLGNRLSERLGDSKTDAMYCCVPRDAKKKRLKGVDQAYELADAAAKAVGKRAFSPIVSRGGADQKTMSGQERARAAEEKYRWVPDAPQDVRGRDVILFDDIITTGSTVLACAALLMRNGARSVTVAAAARTKTEKGKD